MDKEIYDITRDLMVSRPTSNNFESAAIVELADKVKQLDDAFCEYTEKVNGATKSLLEKQLLETKKVVNSVSEQLILTQSTLKHLLLALLVPPTSEDEHQKAWIDLRDSAKNFLEQSLSQ